MQANVNDDVKDDSSIGYSYYEGAKATRYRV